MFVRKKKPKPRPPFSLSFKSRRLALAASKSGGLAKKKTMSISLADLGVAAIGSSNPPTLSPPVAASTTSDHVPASCSGFDGSSLPPKGFPPSTLLSVVSPPSEVANITTSSGSALSGFKSKDDVIAPERNYAALLKSSAQLRELGSPTEHVSGVPFVLIPDENIEAAKLEFKDFIYARFHGDYPSMGKIIGVVNAVWAKTGPRIYVHNIGQGMFLLRVTNPKAREVLLSRTCWNIGGLPMFVAPWSPDYSPDEPPLTTAIVPVEMRNVPYLLFNQESLSRIATAIGKPDSLAPETERKENFEVAKLYVKVDLTAPLPQKIVSGFSNGREVQIDVLYPWLPVHYDVCKRFGHKTDKCTFGTSNDAKGHQSARKFVFEPSRRRSKSRPGRSRDKVGKKEVLRYVPVARSDKKEGNDVAEETVLNSSDGEVADKLVPPRTADQVLEEGEISEAELQINAGCVVPPESAPLAPQIKDVEECGLQTELTASDKGLFVFPSDSTASAPGITDRVSSDTKISVEGAGIITVEKSNPQSDKDPPDFTANADRSVTALELKDEDGSTPPLLAGPGREQGQDIDPPEDHENPFCLVKNRKSGRKVTKHN
ncbi:BnaA10g03650D [Brassica napus]|uniref:(rape) hypothetical protein n=1 Tax=Brassica napus TaxID=3708 RepID=A0A078IBR4_BRANA|nr:unnamed protein product [Brassica napus]CDY47281.1 BnaA10g03650D [Brassica napus]